MSTRPANPTAASHPVKASQEHHVLILEDEKGRRSISLEAATYSIGRDPTNAIMIDSKTVSRQHALLLRLPNPGTNQYRYRLADGNSEGRLSVNGVTVNGKKVTTIELRSGDSILFGKQVQATYQVLQMGEAEFTKYLDMINFQSIKSAPVNAYETMYGDDEEEDQDEVTTFLTTPVQVTAPAQPVSIWQRQWFKYVSVGVVGMVIGLGFGGGVLVATGQLNLKTFQFQANQSK
jgi:pSer/pThr/pTyr-binding forkhead associated (FHA) protein